MKITNKKLGILIFTMLLCLQIMQLPSLVKAATIHNVSNVQQFDEAVSTINSTSGTHVINLHSDITFDGGTYIIPSIQNGDTTIIGNGHKITIVGNRNGLNVTNGATLSLGNSTDSYNTLTITYNGGELNLPMQSALVTVSGKSTVNIYDGVTIKDNVTSGFTHGGGLVIDDATLNMYGGVITNNKITTLGSYSGAGIALMNHSTAYILGNSKITNNTSVNNGGAIALHNYSTLNIADNVEISQNQAQTMSSDLSVKWGGGAIYAHNSFVNISGEVAIKNNKSFHYGAGIFAFGSDIKLSNNVHTISNTANTIGGGIFIWNATLTVDDTVIIRDNSAISAGNNLFIYSYDDLFTLNTTENINANREQLIDIRYGSSSKQLDFAVTGIGASTVNSNEDINKYFTYEISSYFFDMENVSNHLILKEKNKLPVPEIKIDYFNEVLVNYEESLSYTINSELQKPAINIDWGINSYNFGETINFMAFSPMYYPSDIQSLFIPLRPAIPSATIEADGTISNVDETMEYSLDGGLSWKTITGSEIYGLPNGQNILIRVKATDTSFKSEAQSFTIILEPPLTTYKVTYEDGLLNEEIDVPVDNNAYVVNAEVNIDASNLSRKGYTFIGWKDESNTDPITIINGKFMMPSRNVTLTAQWRINDDVLSPPDTADYSNMNNLILLIIICGITAIYFSKINSKITKI